MFSRLHRHFGTAGLVVAIVALVAALSGAAIAASGGGGLTAKQKKEVKAIAKSFQGTGPAGAPGKDGSNGSAGAKGDTGAPGSPGKDGVSPVGTAFNGAKAPCTEGGIEYKGVTTNLVCNGKKGEIAPEILPPGKSETGAWSFGDLTAGSAAPFAFYRIPVSFTIKLGNAIPEANVHYINTAGKEIEDLAGTASAATSTVCTGTAAAPTAAAGHLCVYEGGLEHGIIGKPSIKKLDATEETGASTAGAYIGVFNTAAEGRGFGSWAVTAEL
jgi:hypothetical protein